MGKMIYTVTFSPALDYVIHTDKLKDGAINRFSEANIFCGRKRNKCFIGA